MLAPLDGLFHGPAWGPRCEFVNYVHDLGLVRDVVARHPEVVVVRLCSSRDIDVWLLGPLARSARID